MTSISVRLNLKNFIFISCAVLELLSKVSRGGLKIVHYGACFVLLAFFCDKALTIKVDKTCKIRCLEEVPINTKDKKLFFGYIYGYSKIKTWGNEAFCSN